MREVVAVYIQQLEIGRSPLGPKSLAGLLCFQSNFLNEG